MRKQEAAEFLGVSTRTIERLATEGRLKVRREKGKTKPIVVFDVQDLERIKKEREEARPLEVFGRPNTAKPLDSIGFRLDPLYVRMLEEQAKAKGISASAMARHLVIQGLEESRFERIRDELLAMRDDFGDFYFALLVTQFGMTEAAANEFVKDTLLKRRGA
jgi:excisionase family DNA binding protein